ncbi:MAG: cytidylyltransferase domain-containing protein, partial [Spirochaetia bacterium]
MIGLFLQVRLGSNRLPEKALLPLAGMTVIDHVLQRLKLVEADVYALLTDSESYSRLQPYTDYWGVNLFVGPAEDVLKRYVLAAKEYGTDHIIRATGDNPLVSYECANAIREYHLEQNCDYSGFVGMPLGFGVEVLRTGALEKALDLTESAYDREHVSPFLYNNPDMFSVCRPQAPQEYLCPDARITLDTDADYRYISRIFAELHTGTPIASKDIMQ